MTQAPTSELCDFVYARLLELEMDAPLLSTGKNTGVITQTWVEREVQAKRRVLDFYMDNLKRGHDPRRSGAMHSMKMTIYAMADVYPDHPDYDRDMWGE